MSTRLEQLPLKSIWQNYATGRLVTVIGHSSVHDMVRVRWSGGLVRLIPCDSFLARYRPESEIRQ